jgi:hypothetical protein
MADSGRRLGTRQFLRAHPITLALGAGPVAALWLLSSCMDGSKIAQANGSGSEATLSSPSVLQGTEISVALGSNISSGTAKVGDAWHGTVTENVTTRNETVIPPGSEVDGVIAGVIPAMLGSPAMLDLSVHSIRVNGHIESIAANSEPVIAGSLRARNLGAIFSGAAVVEQGGRGVDGGNTATAGGFIRRAAIAHVPGRFKGREVVLSTFTVMNFTVSRTVTTR